MRASGLAVSGIASPDVPVASELVVDGSACVVAGAGSWAITMTDRANVARIARITDAFRCFIICCSSSFGFTNAWSFSPIALNGPGARIRPKRPNNPSYWFYRPGADWRIACEGGKCCRQPVNSAGPRPPFGRAAWPYACSQWGGHEEPEFLWRVSVSHRWRGLHPGILRGERRAGIIK